MPSGLVLAEDDGDEVQVLAGAGLHGPAVADGVFVVLGQPVGPDLVVALHLADGEGLSAAAAGDHVRPVGHIVHVAQLFRRLGQQQLRRQVVVAVADHAGDGDVDVAAGLDEGQQLVVQIAGVAAEVVVRIGGDHGVEEVAVEGQGGGVGGPSAAGSAALMDRTELYTVLAAVRDDEDILASSENRAAYV